MSRNSRQKIFEATLAMLEEGDGHFTYERLATRAGVSRQTIYSQFPGRFDLLVATVDYTRDKTNAQDLAAEIYGALTARDALDALLRFHAAYTPKVMRAALILEGIRAHNPELSARFDQRSNGRRQTIRHVLTRLAAEGDLSPTWTIDAATDLVATLFSAAVTTELLDLRGWSIDELTQRLQDLIEHTLLTTAPPKKPAVKKSAVKKSAAKKPAPTRGESTPP